MFPLQKGNLWLSKKKRKKVCYLDASLCGLSLIGGGVALNKPGSFILPGTSILRSLASDFSSEQRNKLLT